jgi:hypothetical protein
MIDIHLGLTGVSLFIFMIICYKYFRYNYLVVTGTVYDIEMAVIILLSLLNAFICIIILKEQIDSVFLLGGVLNYIGIFTLGAKVTTSRLNQMDIE